MTRDLATVADIVESANAILEYVDGVTEQEFLEDVRLQDAVIRRIEVIGEAAGRLSAAFREERAGIPWREIRGMRNRMIHVYDDIDMDLVWRTIQTDIPGLLAELAPLVAADSASG